MSTNTFSAVVRVISDVETKTVGAQNLAKCNSVHNSSYKDDSAFFINLNFWGSKGGAAEKVIKNGDEIFVRGSLQCNKVGERTYFNLSVDDFCKVGLKKERGEKAAPVKGETPEPVAVSVDEDLPF